MQICPSCGEEIPDRFRFCGYCGTLLGQRDPSLTVRRTVTIVFCDLKGSTDLGEKLDSEALREVLDVYFTAMRSALQRHGGTIEKYIGDAIMAVFGLPRLHEDDALRAVRAARDMQTALVDVNGRLEARWGVRLQTRIGVNTGEVVTGDPATGQYLVTGDAVNVAARLEQAAGPMEVLIGETTYRLVRDAVSVERMEPLELKGKAQRVGAYRLLDVRDGGDAGRRTDTPMVGRTEELAALIAALDRAGVRRAAELVTVVAPAGVGKSRLVAEFLRQAAPRATLLRGRCLSYGEGVTFAPLVAVVRDAAGILDDDPRDVARAKLDALIGPDAADITERIASLIGLTPAVYPVQETFWATRRFLEIVARSQPVVMVIDDIHWAEPTLLDLLDHLVEAADDAAILVLCSARPELLEIRPSWQIARVGIQLVTLEPLTDEESAGVVTNLLGDSALVGDVQRRIVDAAQGNPLFVEQMLAMLIDDAVLVQDERGHWSISQAVSAIVVPPGINALLTARLDRLPPVERTALGRGAVAGQSFDRDAVEHLCPDDVRPHVPASLINLTLKDLIAATDPAFSTEDAFRFVNALVHHAAYKGLLKRTRADLHEKFVGWLDVVSGDRYAHDEIRGYHLEQAFLALLDLGPADGHAVDLGRRGSGYLAAAGERARARGDMPAAAGLLRRAAALLPDGDALRPNLLLHAGEALGEMGKFDDANALLSEAEDAAKECDDRALTTTAAVVRLMLRFMAEPESAATSQVADAAGNAMNELEILGAHAGLARAWRLMMYVHFMEGNFSAADAAARRAVAEAELAEDRVLEVRFLAALASCVVYSPTPVPEAIQQCEQVLERSGGDLRTVAITLGAMSHIEAMRGDFERARDLYARSRAILTELGFTLSAAIVALQSGPAEMLAGDLSRAENELRKDFAALTALGHKGYLTSVAGMLADVLHAQGRLDEARSFAAVCHESAAPDDVAAQYQWHAIQAKLSAADGRLEEAESLARESLRLIRTTDQPDIQGEALVTLAFVLQAAGKAEAATALADAISLFDQKGNIISAGRARVALGSLPAVRGAAADGDLVVAV